MSVLAGLSVHIGTKLFVADQRVKKIEKNLLEVASKKLPCVCCKAK